MIDVLIRDRAMCLSLTHLCFYTKKRINWVYFY